MVSDVCDIPATSAACFMQWMHKGLEHLLIKFVCRLKLTCSKNSCVCIFQFAVRPETYQIAVCHRSHFRLLVNVYCVRKPEYTSFPVLLRCRL